MIKKDRIRILSAKQPEAAKRDAFRLAVPNRLSDKKWKSNQKGQIETCPFKRISYIFIINSNSTFKNTTASLVTK